MNKQKESLSPVPKKEEEKQRTYKFSETIEFLLAGKKIHKLEWENKQYYAYLLNDILCLHKPDGKDYKWILSKADLQSADYVLL